jgi:hypothetical protein
VAGNLSLCANSLSFRANHFFRRYSIINFG